MARAVDFGALPDDATTAESDDSESDDGSSSTDDQSDLSSNQTPEAPAVGSVLSGLSDIKLPFRWALACIVGLLVLLALIPPLVAILAELIEGVRWTTPSPSIPSWSLGPISIPVSSAQPSSLIATAAQACLGPLRVFQVVLIGGLCGFLSGWVVGLSDRPQTVPCGGAQSDQQAVAGTDEVGDQPVDPTQSSTVSEIKRRADGGTGIADAFTGESEPEQPAEDTAEETDPSTGDKTQDDASAQAHPGSDEPQEEERVETGTAAQSAANGTDGHTSASDGSMVTIHQPKLALTQFDDVALEPAREALCRTFPATNASDGAGEVVISDLTEERLDQLRALPALLEERRQPEALYPLLLGVPQTEPETLAGALGPYDSTIFVDAENRADLYPLLEVLPEVTTFPDNSTLDGVGSATLHEVPVEPITAASMSDPELRVALRNELIEHLGRPLHEYARSLRDEQGPDLAVISTPQSYYSAIRDVFENRDVETRITTAGDPDTITVVRLYLEETLSPERFATTGTDGESNETVDTDWDEMPRPPEPDTGSETPKPNQHTVQVRPDVLDEMAAHAASEPETEIYGVTYAQNNCIVKYHPIQSEEYVLRKPRQVSFTNGFTQHIRHLASLYKELGLRLSGDIHSHPQSGEPVPSDADLRSFRNTWHNDRNTYFIVGLDDGDGPSEWSYSSNINEARRTLDGHLVRIRAYNPEGDQKRIEFESEM